MKSLVTFNIGLFEFQGIFHLQILSDDQHACYNCVIDQNSAQIVSQWEDIGIKKIPELPAGTLLTAPKNRPLKEVLKIFRRAKYYNTEESFIKFQASKLVCTVAEYQEIMETNDDAECYDGVAAVLLYDHKIPIFQIKKGETWRYDMQSESVRGRFAYFKFSERKYENNSLEKVERAMFKDFLEFYN